MNKCLEILTDQDEANGADDFAAIVHQAYLRSVGVGERGIVGQTITISQRQVVRSQATQKVEDTL